jgi:Glycosyltransferases, probably involved in cell wall biogenesis
VPTTLPIILALPWIAFPVIVLLRSRSRSLDEFSAIAPADAPLVSLVIPARNEAHNIERCVVSALAADYPALEVIVVDDHSTDGTGAIVAELAATDPRLRVVIPPALPDGWFGKQWACATGARVARGTIIGFLDADTRQTPDLVPRAINAMHACGSDMLTVAGDQELGSFWERLLQPQVFAVMFARYGGTETVNGSPRAVDKIANGQCLFVRRAAYDAIGGHESVKHKVAEDLALAQRFFVTGHATTMVLGLDQLSTRMYRSLHELIEGWGKNMYAGGREAMPFGRAGALVYPFALVAPALTGLVPPILLLLALAGLANHGVLLWASIASAAMLVWWLAVYAWLRMSPIYAMLYPLGAAMLLYITTRAVARGSRVRWKGREYTAG